MISERLRQARLMRGVTQQQVVDRLADLGVTLTKAGLSKYERGGSVPSASLLLKLSKSLGVPPRYVLEEPQITIEWMAFRKHLCVPKKKQEQIKALAGMKAERQVWLQEKLFPDTAEELPPPTKTKNPEEAEQMAERLRSAWGISDNPIESLTETLEDRGCVVVEYAEGDQDFDGLCGIISKRFGVVVTNTNVPDDRRRLTMAHEVGHLLMDCHDLPIREEERLAYRFAGALLVSKGAVQRELGAKRRRLSIEELKLLKMKYGLSMQAWIHRALDLDIISRGHYQSLCRHFSTRGWRRREPVDYCGNETPMKLKQMILRALAEDIITPSKAEDLLPGCTIEAEQTGKEESVHMVAGNLLKLPKRKRDKILSQAAAMAKSHYQKKSTLTEFEAFGEKDFVDE